MPRSKPPYPPQLRRGIIELDRSGRATASLAREFEVSENSIRIWAKLRDLEDGQRIDGLTSDERAELQQLRREVRQLREEREILKEAAAWFAQEATAVPGAGDTQTARKWGQGG